MSSLKYFYDQPEKIRSCGGGKTGLYFIDLNPQPVLTDNARCVTARQDSGISKRRGEHSGVFIESDEPRAVIR